MESIRPARKWQMRRGVVGTVALLLALSACDTSGGTATTNSGSGNAVAAAVTDNVAKYKGLPPFTAPGDAIDPSTLRGKSMFLIPLVPNPFNQNIQETMEAIAKKVGMNFTIYPNQGTPSEWVQGMNAALTAKPDIIVLPEPLADTPALADLIASHPAIRALGEGTLRIHLPRGSASCGGPFVIEAVKALADARRRVVSCQAADRNAP